MNLAELTIPITQLSRFEEAWSGPIAFVALNQGEVSLSDLRLPPCPTIGLGPSHHPLASLFDAIVETSIACERLARAVIANSHAAAVLVQVLRLTGSMPIADALTVESMAYAVLQGSAEHCDWLVKRRTIAMESSTPGHVRVLRENDRLRLTLDRAEANNAIDRSMRDELATALTLAGLDREVTRIDLDARGKAFSLGADLREFGTTTDPATAHAIRARTLPARAAIGCAERMVVHVDGACVGAGLELAAFAGKVMATTKSWFQLPELAMGIIPGAGGCVSLPRRIGRQRTALMVLSGRRIGAREALDWGLIDALVDDTPADESGSDVA